MQRTQNFVLFDVVYEDGSQRSNRRVSADLLGAGVDAKAAARAAIEQQDRDIAAKSGRQPLSIRTVTRSRKQ